MTAIRRNFVLIVVFYTFTTFIMLQVLLKGDHSTDIFDITNTRKLVDMSSNTKKLVEIPSNAIRQALPTCSPLSCKADCPVSVSVSRTSRVIHVGGQVNTWTMGLDVLILELEPGLCQVANKKEFNLTIPYKSSALYNYLSNIQAGTMVVGAIGPLTPAAVLKARNAKGLSLTPTARYDVSFPLANNRIKAFVAMSKLEYLQQKEMGVKNGTAMWSTDIYIGKPMKVSMDAMDMTLLEQRYSTVQAGIGWSPPDCQPRSTIAIIMPFRDREHHLRIFFNNIIHFLQTQNIAFHVFVIEQVLPEMFNKALLMNVGYLQARKRRPFDCFVFHDVDLVPEDACNFYTCSSQPRHLTVAIDKFNYRLYYEDIFGGGTIFSDKHMRQIHGFTNVFFGWGGEDDNISGRVVKAGYQRLRYPGYIARYRMIPHHGDRTNIKSDRTFHEAWGFVQYAPVDGYNNSVYTVVETQTHKLYTRIMVKIHGAPTTKKEARTYLLSKEKEFKKLMAKQVNSTRSTTEKITKYIKGLF